MVLALIRFRIAPPPARAAGPSSDDLLGAPPGLLSSEVLSDAKAPELVYLATRWTDLRAFRRWHASATRRRAGGGGAGALLDRGFRVVLFLDRRAHPEGTLAASTLPLESPDLASRFLAASATVHFLALGPSGAVRACNDAVRAALGARPGRLHGQRIWRFLGARDAETVRRWLNGGSGAAPERAPLTLLGPAGRATPLEVHAARRGDALVLLGEPVRADEVPLRGEIAELAASLALARREGARRARAMQRALAKLRGTLHAMQRAHAVWEATAALEAALRELERSFARLERGAPAAVR
ncbi:MAG TPA: antibiotic biosynthesis monooxygenase, partial [Gemmatimonadales bacterium]|nr:antibiotic biosynthesis monooxygenase [Gemmatimonadales bacterium]